MNKIDAMDTYSWKKASRSYKINWLKNHIAYTEYCAEITGWTPLLIYNHKRYVKRLNRLLKSVK